MIPTRWSEVQLPEIGWYQLLNHPPGFRGAPARKCPGFLEVQKLGSAGIICRRYDFSFLRVICS
jgi:hypothetical protein